MKIGLVSDAHGHGAALDKALEVLERQGAERLFFLGDSVGYIPSTSALETLVDSGLQIACVLGNHESALLKGISDTEKDQVYLHSALSGRIESLLPEVASWPRSRSLELASQKILMVHGSPTAPTDGYVYPDSALHPLDTNYDFIFMGHTHRPFCKRVNGTNWVNVGSCGLPRDDGRYGSVALVDLFDGRVQLLRFNIEEETRQVVARHPEIHKSVLSVFQRRASSFEGKLVS